MTAAVIGEADVVSARAQRADRFRRYLDAQWAVMDDLGTGFDWTPHSKRALGAIRDLESRLTAIIPDPPTLDE